VDTNELRQNLPRLLISPGLRKSIRQVFDPVGIKLKMKAANLSDFVRQLFHESTQAIRALSGARRKAPSSALAKRLYTNAEIAFQDEN